jgi:pimeloyl-ACP methyl ester carboxylesterase
MINKLFSACLLLFITTQLCATIKEVDLSGKCKEDFVSSVKSIHKECIRLNAVEPQQNNPEELVIFLHGDFDATGYDSLLSQLSKNNRMIIALVRPGYFDNEGNFSTGSYLGVTSSGIAGQLDSYTQHNIDIIGNAILKLKQYYKPKRLLLIGHSGGAAISGLLLNAFPKLADGALLINCPCDIKRWRPGWEKSLSPIDNITHIPPQTIIRVISGSMDEQVYPELAKTYTEQLIKNSKNAKFYLGMGMEHNLRTDPAGRRIFMEAVNNFLHEFSQK